MLSDLGFYVCSNGHKLEASVDLRNDDVGALVTGHQLRKRSTRKKAVIAVQEEEYDSEPSFVRKRKIIQWALEQQIKALETHLGFGIIFHVHNYFYIYIVIRDRMPLNIFGAIC